MPKTLPRFSLAPQEAAGLHEGEAELRIGAMVEKVRASGLKLTPQRLAIVREIASDPTHPTAQELFERLQKVVPSMSFATVYNTLDALASAGLCAALSLSPGASRFEPNMTPHHHAVCDCCGLVRDIDVAALPQDEPSSATQAVAIDEAPGFHVRTIERIYRGLCADCAEQGESAAHLETPPRKKRGKRAGASDAV